MWSGTLSTTATSVNLASDLSLVKLREQESALCKPSWECVVPLECLRHIVSVLDEGIVASHPDCTAQDVVNHLVQPMILGRQRRFIDLVPASHLGECAQTQQEEAQVLNVFEQS